MSDIGSMGETTKDQIQQIFERESRRVFASLAWSLRDLDLAEDSMKAGFAAAVDQWVRNGIPEKPVPWLVSAGRFQTVDIIRRREKLTQIRPEFAQRIQQVAEAKRSLERALQLTASRFRTSIPGTPHSGLDEKIARK